MTAAQKKRVRRLLRLLAKLYPETRTALEYRSPVQLLVATILSAQCTDVRVNRVTPALFKRFPDAAAFAKAKRSDIEEMIKSTGFFRNKARHIQESCRAIVEQFNGEVPRTLDELVKLRGIGRKTANVVLGDAFGVPGITVDTHVGRLSRRLGLTKRTDPEKVERDLMILIPRTVWIPFSHRLIYHGRQVCFARKPKCDECTLAEICPKVGVKSK